MMMAGTVSATILPPNAWRPGAIRVFDCRRRDSNPHPVNQDGILNPARLPIPPLRHLQVCLPYRLLFVLQ